MVLTGRTLTPFIALYDAQHQVMAALELDFRNASVWIEAGQATAMIASVSEERDSKLSEALFIFAQACKLEPSSLDAIIKWTTGTAEKEAKGLTQIRKEIGRTVQGSGANINK